MSKSERKMDPEKGLLKEKVPTPNHDIDWCKFSKSSMFKKLDNETIHPIMEVLKTCYGNNELQSKSLLASSIKTMCNSIFKMMSQARTQADKHNLDILNEIENRTQKADVQDGKCNLEIPNQQVNADANSLLKLDGRLEVNSKSLNLWLNVLEHLGINIVENQKEVKHDYNDYVPFIWTGVSNKTKTKVAVKDAKQTASSYKDISTKNYL